MYATLRGWDASTHHITRRCSANCITLFPTRLVKLHRLKTLQRLPIRIEEAWSFFSDPQNLRAITPPWLDFQVTSDMPERMHAGMIVSYTVRPMLKIPVRWVTEITHVNEPHFFVDEQRFGPYRLWHHQHHFRPIAGGVEMEDLVHYVLPFGPLGSLVHAVQVRKQLKEIFDYRYQVLEEHFGKWEVSPELTLA